MDAILVVKTDLEASCFGRMIMMNWHLGLEGLGTWWVARMIVRAYVLGLWRNARRLKIRKF